MPGKKGVRKGRPGEEEAGRSEKKNRGNDGSEWRGENEGGEKVLPGRVGEPAGEGQGVTTQKGLLLNRGGR